MFVARFDVDKNFIFLFQLHTNHLQDSYSSPPADAFAPGYQPRRPIQIPSGSYGAPPSRPSFPSSPPSGSYGAPPLTSGLPLQHGSISGNVRQLPTTLLSPERPPVAFRQPVPVGLLESIGHGVQLHDTFGIHLQQQQQHSQSIYIPPPTNEIPPPPAGLESLPLAPAIPFSNQLNLQDDLRLTSVQQPCNHGPQLQNIYGVPNSASFEVGPSTIELAHNSIQTSYGPPPSGLVFNPEETNVVPEPHSPASSYGPPPSGNPADSLAFGSQKSSSTLEIDGKNAIQNDDNKVSNDESKVNELPGLSGTGLNIISAQKSQQVEIPVQGQLGTYSLQIQSANPLASVGNDGETPDHQKLLSEGLLQSILSAIEQPKQQHRQQTVDESLANHPEIEKFVQSQTGQETLNEPKAEK